MKKSHKILLSLLALAAFLSLLLILNNIQAQDEPIPGMPLGLTPEKVDTIAENVQNESYLKQEWGKILEKSQFGKFILGISSVLQALSPIFKLLLGIEYSLSWFFFIALGIWITVFIIIFNPIKEIFEGNNWVSIGIAFIIPTLAAQFGTIAMLTNMLVPLITNPWLVWCVIIVVAVLLWLYIQFMETYGEKLKEQNKKEDEERRERKANTIEKIHDIEMKGAGI